LWPWLVEQGPTWNRSYLPFGLGVCWGGSDGYVAGVGMGPGRGGAAFGGEPFQSRLVGGVGSIVGYVGGGGGLVWGWWFRGVLPYRVGRAWQHGFRCFSPFFFTWFPEGGFPHLCSLGCRGGAVGGMRVSLPYVPDRGAFDTRWSVCSGASHFLRARPLKVLSSGGVCGLFQFSFLVEFPNLFFFLAQRLCVPAGFPQPRGLLVAGSPFFFSEMGRPRPFFWVVGSSHPYR